MTVIFRQGIYLALVGLLLVGGLFAFASLTGCDDEECLVNGENCSSSYKENNYGTTDIYCCEGSCTRNSLGDSVCR